MTLRQAQGEDKRTLTGRQRQLLDVLVDLAGRGSGMPSQTALSEHLEVETWKINALLRELVQAGALDLIARGGKGTRSSYRLTASGQVLASDQPVKLATRHAEGQDCATRRCLKCGHDFLSTHKGNRICEACKSLTVFDHEDRDTYAVALEPKAGQRTRMPQRLGIF